MDDEGRVVARGSHDELIAAEDPYADFWRVQVGDFEHLPEELIERARRRGSAAEPAGGDDWRW